jgi:hypothetical protein
MSCMYLHSLEEAESPAWIAQALKGVWFTRPDGSLDTFTNSLKMYQRFLEQEEAVLKEYEDKQQYEKQLAQKIQVEHLREKFIELFTRDAIPMPTGLPKPFIVSFADDSDDEEEAPPMTITLSQVTAYDNAWLDDQYKKAQEIRQTAEKEYKKQQWMQDWSARLYKYHQQWNGEQDMEFDEVDMDLSD